jgi:purine-nucleoside phosphorylase
VQPTPEEATLVEPTLVEPFQAARASAASLARLSGAPSHDVAVILGSGWADAAAAIGSADAEIPLADLGGFPPPTVPGHSPVVRSVSTGGVRALIFLGRVHLYEGHPPATVVHGVRAAIAAGCRVIVLTNAAGGISEYGLGEPVLIRDHLNLTGRSPLTGPAPPAGPSRFTDLTEAYSRRLRKLAREIDPSLAEGVYAGLLGPQYETPAEIRMLRTLGADMVGMSTVLETIAARHLGAEVLGLSLVTNSAAGLGPELAHDDVVAAGKAAADRVGALLAAIVPRAR